MKNFSVSVGVEKSKAAATSSGENMRISAIRILPDQERVLMMTDYRLKKLGLTPVVVAFGEIALEGKVPSGAIFCPQK